MNDLIDNLVSEAIVQDRLVRDLGRLPDLPGFDEANTARNAVNNLTLEATAKALQGAQVEREALLSRRENLQLRRENISR